MAKSSISTMWAIGRFERAADFVAKAREIGFDQIELNHQVTEGMLQEYRALKAAGEVDVSSVHAPCPKWQPDGMGSLPELSSLDETIRVAAVDIIKRTIDVAVDLQAEAVVVHCGRVEIDGELERTLRRLYVEGRSSAEEYGQRKSELIAARASGSERHLEAAIASLKEVADYAAGAGVRIGLENRYHYYEIPLPDEMRTILDSLDSSTVFYWHDSGHAHNLAALRLVAVEDWLPAFRGETVGLHLHDATGLQDHRVAGVGEIDLAIVKQLAPPTALRICEFDRVASPEDVQAGYNYLKRLGFF